MSTIPTGTFVWYELMSTAPERAGAFYTELFGWTIESADMGGDAPYTAIKLGDKWVGGVMPLDAAHGTPSHWMNYISVPDVDAACAQIVALGGKVNVPAFDIPTIGRTAFVQAPDGSVFAPFSSSSEPPPSEGPPPAGTFCWQQLQAKDLDATVAFYTTVFGWTVEEMPAGGPRTVGFKAGDKMVATAMAMPTEVPAPTHWQSYVAVEDINAVYARAQGLDARSYHHPTEIPGMGTFAVLAGPDGAVFCLWQANDASNG